MTETGLGAFAHVTIGVAALDDAIAFWTTNFGLAVRDRQDGPDAELGRLWGISAQRIRRQAWLATPLPDHAFARAGAIHLVEFRDPLPPVRRGAQVYDRLPKNLDIYTVDMATRYAELQALGHRFRGQWSEIPAGLHRFREVHLPGHDEINVVLIEVIGPGYATPLSPMGYAGIGPLVTIVGDVAEEARFYGDVLGLTTTLTLLLKGPEIERTVGLPPGAGLDLRVFGAPDEPLGRIEVIEYQQVAGKDLYPRARPPATGILHVNYEVANLAPLRECLTKVGVQITEHGNVDALFGTGTTLSFHSPAGFRIEVRA